MSGLFSLLLRDVLLAVRKVGELFLPLVFMVVIAVLFVFALGPDPEQLRTVGYGVTWVALLLVSHLTLHRIFVDDYDSGVLEYFYTLGWMPEGVVFVKCVAHWLMGGVLLGLLSPLLFLFFGLTWTIEVFVVLCVGTLLLSFLGGLGELVSLGARSRYLVVPLLVLPLEIPVLIFGVSALTGNVASFYLLVGLVLFMIPASIWLMGVAFKDVVQD